jgi:hypothetical protein
VDFEATCPPASRPLLGPIVYGECSDSAGIVAIGTPALTADTTDEFVPPTLGYKHLPGTAPTDLILTDNINSIGQFWPGFFNGQNGEAAVHGQVWVIKGGTTPTDPFPYIPFTAPGKLPLIFQSDPAVRNREVQMQCTPVAGFNAGAGDLYAFALGELDPGGSGLYLWEQVLTSTTPDVTFTTRNHEHFEGDPPITPGATVAVTGALDYVATATVAGTETVPTAIATGYIGPYIEREEAFAWTTVASATVYSAYSRPKGSIAFTKHYAVPTSQTRSGHLYFENDGTDVETDVLVTFTDGAVPAGPTIQGVIPAIDVGNFVDSTAKTWGGFVIAAHAVTSVETSLALRSSTVTTVLTADGTTVDTPGFSGFNTRWATPYRDVATGMRYTLVYVFGDNLTLLRSGNASLFVNAVGVEDVGDGSGTALLKIEDQIAHFFDNYVGALPSYSGGLWALAPPTWSDNSSRRDTASFTQYATSADATFMATREAAWIIMASTLIADQLARLMVLADGLFAFTREGSFRLVLDLPNAAPPSPVAAYTEVSDYLEDMFTFTLDTSSAFFWNSTNVSYDPQWDINGAITYAISSSAVELTSKAQYGVLQNPNTLEFAALISSARQQELLTRRMARARNPTLIGTADLGIVALLPQLGDYVTGLHREAPWSPTQKRSLLINNWSPDLDNDRVTLICYDADAILTSDIVNIQNGFTGLSSSSLPPSPPPVIPPNSTIAALFGDAVTEITNTSYPSGSGGDKLHYGSSTFSTDSAGLTSAFRLIVSGFVSTGVTLTVGLFNLTDAPNTALVEATITSGTPVTVASGVISFAPAGAVKTYGIKVKVSAGSGFAWAASIKGD